MAISQLIVLIVLSLEPLYYESRQRKRKRELESDSQDVQQNLDDYVSERNDECIEINLVKSSDDVTDENDEYIECIEIDLVKSSEDVEQSGILGDVVRDENDEYIEIGYGTRMDRSTQPYFKL